MTELKTRIHPSNKGYFVITRSSALDAVRAHRTFGQLFRQALLPNQISAIDSKRSSPILSHLTSDRCFWVKEPGRTIVQN